MILVQIVTENSPISAVIRFGTRSWASHAEFISFIGDDHLSGITLGSRLNGGVEFREAKDDNYTHVEMFSASGIVDAFVWAKSQRGKPYDKSAIFGIISDRDIHDESKWFCSELISVAFEETGHPLLSTRPSAMPWRITPRDLLLSRELKYVSGWTKKNGVISPIAQPSVSNT